MASEWTIRFTSQAQKQLSKLHPDTSKRILSALAGNLEKHATPRSFGEPLTGGRAGYWRYRMGDYRIICRIEDRVLTILVVEVGHRREVYR